MVPAGSPATLEMTVVNTSRRRTAAIGLERPDGRWHKLTAVPERPGHPHDTSTPTGPVSGPPGRRAPGTLGLLHLPALDPGTSTSVAMAVPTAGRGMLALPPRAAWVHDPFGLFGVAVAWTPPVVVVVHPRRAQGIETSLIRRHRPATVSVASTTDRHRAAPDVDGEFADLRPYRAGDRLHLVHWPALARHGTLLVRQFDPEAGGVVHIVLDDRTGVHRRGAFEDVLSTVLTLVDRAATLGIPVELTTLSGRRAMLAPTPAGVAGILPLLATLQPRAASATASPGPDPGEGTGRPMMVTTVTGSARLPETWHRRAQVIAR
jgi:hypothetical protein